MKILVTGSCGLIGGEVCQHFGTLGFDVYGIDNNMRQEFFGKEGDTSWTLSRLQKTIGQQYVHLNIDIRDRDAILKVYSNIKPDIVVHAAAQPSHDRAASIPFEDFDTNAVGTFNMLVAHKKYSPNSPFVHLSTNKVYGDSPNHITLKELEKRYDFNDERFFNGIPESFSIDQTKHSLFGSSKVSADISVQEFGRYFEIPTVCLRGGCLTGPSHSGVELHGFLSYLVKANLTQKEYTIFGYKGKQVRDNIHSKDVSRFIEEFFKKPKSGAVYNIGGGKDNTISILEAFEYVQNLTGKEMRYKYSDQNRVGDHICYYSDLSRIRTDYPSWDVKITVQDCIKEIVNSWHERLG
jgi:CDP-paratose 2-epimerase